MSETADWTATLAEVRRAYRIVACYQDRVLEMMRCAGGAFDGLSFANWCATNHDMPPTRSVDPCDRWTWDFIPLYATTVVYNRAGQRRWTITPGEWFVMAIWRADSQFTRGAAPRGDGGPDPQALGDVAEAESRFELIAYQWQADGEKTVDYWDDFYGPEPMEGAEPGRLIQREDRGFRAMTQRWTLDQIDSEQALQDAISAFKGQMAEALGLDRERL